MHGRSSPTYTYALEPWSIGDIGILDNNQLANGPGVKHLARIASRPVTWVIKIKHAGLGVLGQKKFYEKKLHKLQAASSKQQAC